MSTPFTINASNWQEKAEELRLAVSERTKAVDVFGVYRAYRYSGGSWKWVYTTADIPLSGGENLQAVAFFSGIQSDIEAMTYRLSNIDADLSGTDTRLYYYWRLNPSNPFLAFCQTVGGLLYTSDTDYGWPRCSELDENNQPVYTRGRFSVGDYVTGDMIDAIVLALENARDFRCKISAPSGYQRQYSTAERFYTANPTWSDWDVLYNDVIGSYSDDSESESSRGVSFSSSIISSQSRMVMRSFYDPSPIIVDTDVSSHITPLAFNVYTEEIEDRFNSTYNYVLKASGISGGSSYNGTYPLPGPPPGTGWTSGLPTYDQNYSDFEDYILVVRYDFTNA